MKTQTKGIWITLLAAACFGAASPIAKGVYQYDVTVSCVLTWRFFMASILLWAYLMLFRRDLNFRLKKDQLITLAVVGGAAHFLTTQCYFSALKYVPISIQIMFFYTYPFMVNGLSVLLFGEKMNRGQLVSLAAAFVGILMTVSLDDMRLNGIGILLSIGAAACQTAYILLLGRRNVAEVDSLVIGAYSSVFAFLSFLIFSLAKGELRADLALPCWTGIAGMAVFTTAVGAVALALGIKLIGGAKAAIISVFEPIEAILLGVLLFHERLTLRGAVGIALVMGAIVLVNYTQTKNVAE